MTGLGRRAGIPNVQTGTPTTRTTVLLPDNLRAWVDEYSETTRQSITAIVIRLLEQERQQIAGEYIDPTKIELAEFRREWEHRFGFLAEKNPPGSLESIDEVAELLASKQSDLEDQLSECQERQEGGEK